ncbi:hypothetical protein AB0B40_33605 [Streptomyces sp. NPDC042638]|uniref:hypothetical protein n=1 Tax=Streptomyces sp. NPDC042638 TaxID=3154333 RepID=UPI0033C9CC0A
MLDNHLWHMDLLAHAGRLSELTELAFTDVHARRRLNGTLREQGMETEEALLQAVLNRRDPDADTACITPATAFDRLGNVCWRALHGQAHPQPVALYSIMLWEATSTDHPAHGYFTDRHTCVLDTVTAQVRAF